jgi:hypothetical protein
MSRNRPRLKHKSIRKKDLEVLVGWDGRDTWRNSESPLGTSSSAPCFLQHGWMAFVLTGGAGQAPVQPTIADKILDGHDAQAMESTTWRAQVWRVSSSPGHGDRSRSGVREIRIFREYISGEVRVGGRDAMPPAAGRWWRGRGRRRWSLLSEVSGGGGRKIYRLGMCERAREERRLRDGILLRFFLLISGSRG